MWNKERNVGIAVPEDQAVSYELMRSQAPQGCLKVDSGAVFGELYASQREHSFDVVGQRAQSTAN
jgi:hypothetical protein